MLSHYEQKELPYSAGQMFDLVAEVDKYKDFLPWCVASRINEREGDDIFYADLVVGYKMFRERFSSKVILDRPNEVVIEYLKGPLKNLTNQWGFKEGSNGSCIISFSVEFEFTNGAFQALAKMFFNEIVKRMMEAFEARALEVYGSNSNNGRDGEK